MNSVTALEGSDVGIFETADAALLASPVILPCGRTMFNRFVKVAMYEHLASLFGGPPNNYHHSLYSKWAQGGWGMIITGNFQISSTHLSLGRDVVASSREIAKNMDCFKTLAAAIHATTTNNERPLALIQLSHAGRQSPRFIGGRLGTLVRPVAPSAKRLGCDSRESLLARVMYQFTFQTPRALEETEVEKIIEEFTHAAKLLCEAGFDGIQLHAAHGYLLSQFLSPKVNNRSDKFQDGILLIERIIFRIRESCPSSFIIGIKLNAGDYVVGGISEDEAFEHVKKISIMSIDFIEISGGNYENPVFGSTPSFRQVFFASFSRRVMAFISGQSDGSARPLIVLTGGLRTAAQFSRIIAQKGADLLGIGRLSVLHPDLPHLLSPASACCTNPSNIISVDFPESHLYTPHWLPKLLGAGVGTAWYYIAMRQLAGDKKTGIQMDTLSVLFRMWVWAGADFLTTMIWSFLAVFFTLGMVWILLAGHILMPLRS